LRSPLSLPTLFSHDPLTWKLCFWRAGGWKKHSENFFFPLHPLLFLFNSRPNAGFQTNGVSAAPRRVVILSTPFFFCPFFPHLDLTLLVLNRGFAPSDFLVVPGELKTQASCRSFRSPSRWYIFHRLLCPLFSPQDGSQSRRQTLFWNNHANFFLLFPDFPPLPSPIYSACFSALFSSLCLR